MEKINTAMLDEHSFWNNEENEGGEVRATEFWAMVVDRGTDDRPESIVKQPEVRLAKDVISLKTKIASEMAKAWKDEYEVLTRPF